MNDELQYEAEPKDHIWAQIPQQDASQCIRCGLVASDTAIVAGVGTPGPQGWSVGEFSAALPACDENDIDSEMARLLNGDFDQ